MVDILIKNGTVITVDEKNHIYRNGYIAIKDGIICQLGEIQDEQKLPDAKEVLDMKGHAVMPGLVDAHGHGGHCLIKTLGEHYDDEWGEMAEHIYFKCADDEFWYDEAVLAACERLKFGTTTAVSMIGSTPRPDSITAVEMNLAGSSSVGIRQMSGIGTCDGPFPKTTYRFHEDGSYDEITVTPESLIRVTEESVKLLADKYPRAKAIAAPGVMGRRSLMTDEENIHQNKEMFRIAEEYDVPLHTHAYAGDVQFLYDTTPYILTPRLSLTHSIGYSDEEIDILAKTGAYVFHGPTTYSNAVGHCRVIDMLEKGVNIAVVTDGTAPDRSYDLFRDMKNVQLLQRYNHRNYGLLPCGTVLRMVTIEPAKALGIDRITGSLEVGKKADVITINVEQPHLAPFGIMPIQRIVYHAMGQDVDNVIIEGEVVVRNRQITRINENSVLRNAERSFERMLSRLDRKDVIENQNLYKINQLI